MPDFVSEYAGQAGTHQAGEVKVYNTIVTDAAQLLRGATQAFGATRARLLAENLGDYAPSEVVAPRSDGVARTAILRPTNGSLSRRMRVSRGASAPRSRALIHISPSNPGTQQVAPRAGIA